MRAYMNICAYACIHRALPRDAVFIERIDRYPDPYLDLKHSRAAKRRGL